MKKNTEFKFVCKETEDKIENLEPLLDLIADMLVDKYLKQKMAAETNEKG